MATGAVVTFYEDGKWRNRLETAHVFSREYDTCEEAAAAGRKLARAAKVEHIVCNIDGSIAEREPEDHDPGELPE
jgi:hypothetical protein